MTIKNKGKFVVRIPGDGTEELIACKDEQTSTQLACERGNDARLLYFGDDSSKFSEYIPDAVTISADLLEKKNKLRMLLVFLKNYIVVT